MLKIRDLSKKNYENVEKVTRTKIFYRLNNLRGEGLIKGKFIGSGKGVWVWWGSKLFDKEIKQ